jgi:hypothetical protein
MSQSIDLSNIGNLAPIACWNMPKSNSQHSTNEWIKNETKRYVKHSDKLNLKAIYECSNCDMDKLGTLLYQLVLLVYFESILQKMCTCLHYSKVKIFYINGL